LANQIIYQNLIGEAVTSNASGSASQTIPIPTVDGYLPIICGVRTTGSPRFYTNECYVEITSGGAYVVRITVTNASSISTTGTPRVFVLYEKQ